MHPHTRHHKGSSLVLNRLCLRTVGGNWQRLECPELWDSVWVWWTSSLLWVLPQFAKACSLFDRIFFLFLYFPNLWNKTASIHSSYSRDQIHSFGNDDSVFTAQQNSAFVVCWKENSILFFTKAFRSQKLADPQQLSCGIREDLSFVAANPQQSYWHIWFSFEATGGTEIIWFIPKRTPTPIIEHTCMQTCI